MTDRDDASIPTLTIRATTQHEPPVLTEVAHPDEADAEYRRAEGAHPSADQSRPPWDVTPPQPPWDATPPQRTWTGPANAAGPTGIQSGSRANPGTHAGHPSLGDSGATSTPSDAVLRAALQADIEDAVQDALDEALHQVKARLEAELPDIVARAVRRTRLG